MQRIIDYVQGNSALKNALLIVVAFVVDFFSPIVPIILACYLCIFVDMFYGVKVAYKQKKIRSRYAWTGTIKKLRDASIALVLCNVIERFIIGPDSPFALLTVLVAVVVSVTELLSILENLYILDPNGPWRLLGKIIAKKSSDKLGVSEDELKPKEISEEPSKQNKDVQCD